MLEDRTESTMFGTTCWTVNFFKIFGTVSLKAKERA